MADDRHLAQKAVDRRPRGGGLGNDQFERDLPTAGVVPRQVDHSHRPSADFAEGRVMGDRLRCHRSLGAAIVAKPDDHIARVGLAVAGDFDRRRRERVAAGAEDRLAVRSKRDVFRRSSRRPSRPRSHLTDLDFRNPFHPHAEKTRTGQNPVARPQTNSIANPPLVDERPVGAAQVAKLAKRRTDFNQKMIARQCRVFRHRTVNASRTSHDKGVVTIENE